MDSPEGPWLGSRFSRAAAAGGARGKSGSNRLPQFVLGRASKVGAAGQQEVDGDADERVLSDPLALSPALPVERPAQPREVVQLVGTEPEFLALEALPLGSL